MLREKRSAMRGLSIRSSSLYQLPSLRKEILPDSTA